MNTKENALVDPDAMWVLKDGTEKPKALVYYVDDEMNIWCAMMTPKEYDELQEQQTDSQGPRLIFEPGQVPVVPDAPTEDDREIVYYVNEDRELVCTHVTYAEYREMERVHEGFSLMIHALWPFGEQLKLPAPISYAETTTREWCHQHDK